MNVNNDVALGFLEKDLDRMLNETRGKLHLPQILEQWALRKN